MEPRWRVIYQNRFLYVGGTAKFDIWYVSKESAYGEEGIRLAWDHRTWDTWPIDSDGQLGESTWDEPDGPTDTEFAEIERYIMVFASYVNLTPRYTECITEEGDHHD